MPNRTLVQIALLVRDYDEAIAYYTNTLGFTLIEDSPREAGKRWVVVSPGKDGANLLLARAANDRQQGQVGDQCGGRGFLFLHTDDFAREHRDCSARGVKFVESPRYESYGSVAVFEDMYGNRWDLIELKR